VWVPVSVRDPVEGTDQYGFWAGASATLVLS